ncbi:MAG: sulfotransferase family protein [Campylobacterota bacterium]
MNKLFFIVGTGRCGTQMLRNILNVWNDVIILPETHFIVTLYDKYKLEEISCNDFFEVFDNIYGASGHKWVDVILGSSQRCLDTYKSDFGEYVKKEKIVGNIKDYTEAFFEFLYGKDFIFGDKTPHYGTNLDIIIKIWPDAKIIHLMRDGVDSAHSMLGHEGFVKNINGQVKPKDLDRMMYKGVQVNYSNEKISINQALQFWENVILETDKGFQNIKSKNRLEVKYEDIVFYPAKEISKIAEFLDIEDDKKALNKAITIPRAFPEKHQVKKLSDEEYEKCYVQIKETMQEFGYPYKVDIERSFLETLQELYRGRYNYMLSAKKSLRIFIKKLIGRA